jgi:hypothetical protein
MNIAAPRDVLEKIRREATDRGVSLATVIREALEQKAASYHAKPRSLAIADSGRSDLALRTGEEPPVPEPWR